MKTALYLCDSPHKNTSPQPNHEKNIRHIPTEGHSTIYLTIILQKWQGHQKQGKSE